jgi:hypothetical protein
LHCRSDDEPPPPPPSVVTTVDVTAARELMAAGGGGHRFLDVRTEEELARLGHLVEPDRSLNVPYMLAAPQGGGGGRVKNAHFLEQVASLLTKDDHILVVRALLLACLLACLPAFFFFVASPVNATRFSMLPSKQVVICCALRTALQGCQSGKRSELACLDLQAAVRINV